MIYLCKAKAAENVAEVLRLMQLVIDLWGPIKVVLNVISKAQLI